MSVLLILHRPRRQNVPSGRRVTSRRMPDNDGDVRSDRGSSAVARLTGSHLLCERGAPDAVAVGLGGWSAAYAGPRGTLVAAPPTQCFDPPGRASVGVARDTLGLVRTVGGALQCEVGRASCRERV